MLSGLLGIRAAADGVTAQPMIPDWWEHFRVENLWLGGKCYRITYDKTGGHYGQGAGMQITAV